MSLEDSLLGAGPDPRQAHWHDLERAYVDSPFHRLLGISLQVAEEGKSTVRFGGCPDAANRSGTLAGGSIGALIDSAVVQATRTMLGPDDEVATLEMKVNFTRASPAGEPLIARGHVEHLGRTTSVGMARVENARGTLIAVGLVTVSVRRVEAHARSGRLACHD
jgi:uncharacterized protein (TIGR00369 family)